ncbi:hypothetical protein GYMLUDRAFT_251141 [Collybiopsis luxurians FD-317 M1]|uniref:Uncharacterized protein n=1 Tax=Collybiopsis luxurians FD-317 M1 TaxID=944289 RepID=A0A0D0CCD9_9AGAR|nr:hypothetical protein GYMLUDRAFT_251141 [Collybiopsis luxurians FD-317 M1]
MPTDLTQVPSISELLQAFQVNVSIQDLIHVTLNCQLVGTDNDSDIELPEELMEDAWSHPHALPTSSARHLPNVTEEPLSTPAPYPPCLPPHGPLYMPLPLTPLLKQLAEPLADESASNDAFQPCKKQLYQNRSFVKHVLPVEATPSELRSEGLPFASGGFIGVDCNFYGAKKKRGLDDLLEHDFKLIPFKKGQSVALQDNSGHLLAIRVGSPDDPTYLEDIEDMTQAILEKGKAAKWEAKEKKHKRGGFPTVA